MRLTDVIGEGHAAAGVRADGGRSHESHIAGEGVGAADIFQSAAADAGANHGDRLGRGVGEGADEADGTAGVYRDGTVDAVAECIVGGDLQDSGINRDRAREIGAADGEPGGGETVLDDVIIA